MHILPSPSSGLFQLGNLKVFILLRDELTNVDEASGRPAAKLLALEAERDLDDPRDVAGRSLDAYGVRGDQLAPHEHRAEHDLSTDINANERKGTTKSVDLTVLVGRRRSCPR